ncbi:MAG: hydroxymethylbilane synthase [Candidatus Omnitrophota bacterium]
MKALRLGTRGSPLALYQAERVRAALSEKYPGLAVEIVAIKVSGDLKRRGDPGDDETKSVFTREIEEALLAGTVDGAVHSAKDLAADMPAGLVLGAALEREDPRDCLISRGRMRMEELPRGALIGTSSLRRASQIRRHFPHVLITDLHGNIGTRLRKIAEGKIDAVILAYAGLKRLGLAAETSEIFCENKIYPAPGQGVIAVQAREGDPGVLDKLGRIHHGPTGQRLDCERSFLKTLEGGCRLPCGISTGIEGTEICARGILLSPDGVRWAEAEIRGAVEQAGETGTRLAFEVLGRGGQAILDRIRGRKGAL